MLSRFSRTVDFRASPTAFFWDRNFKARRWGAPIAGHDAHASLMHGHEERAAQGEAEGMNHSQSRVVAPWRQGLGRATQDMPMATFLLVHGATLGGWCYQRVSRLLRRAGHKIHTPTLTVLASGPISSIALDSH
jgi:hypothetical protein